MAWVAAANTWTNMNTWPDILISHLGCISWPRLPKTSWHATKTSWNEKYHQQNNHRLEENTKVSQSEFRYVEGPSWPLHLMTTDNSKFQGVIFVEKTTPFMFTGCFVGGLTFEPRPQKNLLLSMKSCLVNRDPYFMDCYNPYIIG